MRQFRIDTRFPDWHRDYHSGTIFPALPYTSYEFTAGDGADIVAAWEPSRLQFMPALIQAYRASGEREHVDMIIRTCLPI